MGSGLVPEVDAVGEECGELAVKVDEWVKGLFH